ncbi:MAG: 6-bladed beta-propeller [Acidobacteriota bacterium]
MKDYAFALSRLLLFPMLIMTIFCVQQKEQWRGTIKSIDGVVVVNNPKKPVYEEDVFKMEEELSIGVAGGEDEHLFSQIGEIAVDDEERIYVSDWKESWIKVFDKSGTFLMIIGKKGQGPGEFEQISGIQITPQNELVGLDSRSRRLSFFSPNGQLIQSRSIGEIQALDIKINSRGNFVARSVTLDPQTALAVTELKIYSANSSPLAKVAATDPQDVFTPFLPFLVWELVDNDTILCGLNKKYEFSVYDSEGKVTKVISRDYDPVRISDEERKESLKRLKQPENKAVPRSHPAYRRFSIDEEGRIFVQVWEKPAGRRGYYHDVFDSRGKYIAKIPFEFPPRVWKKKKLYTIEEDESGFQFVRRHKVEWKTFN